MKKLLTILALVIFNFFLFVPHVDAKVVTMKTGVYVVTEDEVIEDDLFVGAKIVEIYGTVNGDVYLGAETVRVDGIINGDLLAGAGSVNLSGLVRDDVYLGAGNVVLTGAQIGDSLLVGTGNLNLDEETVIGGSLLSGAGNISTKAKVGRNLMVGAGNVDIDSEINGEVRIGGGQIFLGPNTKIDKDFYYALDEENKELNMSEGATISGMVKQYENKYLKNEDWNKAKKEFSSFARGFDLTFKFISYLGALVVGLLLLKFMPKTAEEVSKNVTKMFWKSLGAGALVMLLMIPASISMSMTLIGLPLAGMIFLLFLIATYLAKIYVGLALGKWLTEMFNWKKISVYLSFTLGLLVIFVLRALPLVGFLASLVVLWAGIGSQVLHYKERLASKK